MANKKEDNERGKAKPEDNLPEEAGETKAPVQVPTEGPEGAVPEAGAAEAAEGSGQDNATENEPQESGDTLKWYQQVKSHWRECTAMLVAFVSGVSAFWKVFDQWWFGFRVSIKFLIVLGVALNIIWLVAFCRYLSERKKYKLEPNKKVKLVSWNRLLMVALPVLVLGILVGARVTQKRFEEKVVILIEPFEGDKGGDYDIAKTIQREIESAIPSWLSKHDRVKVVIGAGGVKEGRWETPLFRRVLQSQADMVISGWYSGGDPNTLVCADFHVNHVPQALAAVFRRRESGYPRTFVFSEQEVKTFTVHFTVGKLLGHECIMMLGAGAYASRQWEEAEHYFTKARKRVQEMENDPNFPKKELKGYKGYLYGDKAFLELYLGHCQINQGQLAPAIEHYHAAIKWGRDVPRTDPRHDEIQVNAHLARAMAYREKNEFTFAAHDFQRLGEYGLLRAERNVLAADERGGMSTVRLEVLGKSFYKRGDKYLKDEMHIHAEADLKISVEMLQQLKRTAVVSEEKLKCERLLAESLVRLGEVHRRLAVPELQNDEHTKEAKRRLKEAQEMIEELKRQPEVNAQTDPNLYELHPECLRHLGNVFGDADRIEDVNEAIEYHEKAHGFWADLKAAAKAEVEAQAKIATKAAGELTRIGNVHRRLDDLDSIKRKEHLGEAVIAYERAVEEMRGTDYLEALNPYSTDPKLLEEEECNLLRDSMKHIRTHHLANALSNLGETHVKLSLRLGEPDDVNVPNRLHMDIGCEILRYAVKCYVRAVEKLDDERDPDWIKRIRVEERNRTLKDDLAWCQTLRGFALVTQSTSEPNDSEEYKEYYKEVLANLGAAKSYFEQRVLDQGHLVLNLFTLSVAQDRVGEERKARNTLLEACKLLRELTRKKKKIWYVDYVCYIIGKLPPKLNKSAGITEANQKKLEKWLEGTIVREGRHTLDNIITGMEEDVKKK